MGEIKVIVDRVKLICGIIYNKEVISDIDKIETELKKLFGDIDLRSKVIPFDFTKYYNNEMGDNLMRYWLSFEKLILPNQITDIKIKTNNLESKFSTGSMNGKSSRYVNIDPGYIAPSRLVLVSTKDFSHRIYLSDGIYGEVTLIYKKGKFVKLEWTYPDYTSETALNLFAEVRERLKG